MRPSTILQFSVQRLSCSACGAEANASCDCGKPYVPKLRRAADAIRANPEKSDRAIAAEIGVSQPTVSKARTENQLSVDQPRTGLDGKVRRMPARPEPPEPPPCADCDTEEDFWRRAIMSAAGDAIAIASSEGWKRNYGDWTKFKVTSELLTLVKEAAEAWAKLAQNMEGAS
jgi:hypothetical protein